MPDEEQEKSRDRLVFRLVYLGFVISGLIAVVVIGGVIYLSLFGPTDTDGNRLEIPSVLENWGGIIVGFYFGTFVSLIKDYMKAGK
ncbi:hypothetical protein [Labrenzia sp. PHM005]|uniref:hypothetical protein n=1 Tax=Labrenzia sp. PHM005 TaxID=2590016 RepID=UPI001140112C|nr:hypothetical protein [Labrenzia sp. PHM005]QDG79118.1 hypothetical protein FJ695_26405 [Labrenzia sp. PHM005]